jgi:hypothetical protein
LDFTSSWMPVSVRAIVAESGDSHRLLFGDQEAVALDVAETFRIFESGQHHVADMKAAIGEFDHANVVVGDRPEVPGPGVHRQSRGVAADRGNVERSVELEVDEIRAWHVGQSIPVRTACPHQVAGHVSVPKTIFIPLDRIRSPALMTPQPCPQDRSTGVPPWP